LRGVIPAISNTNAQGEYYLTDMVKLALERGWKVQAVVASDPTEFQGVNTQGDLAAVEKVITQRTQGH